MSSAALTAPARRTRPRGAWGLRLRSDDQLVALFRLGNDEAFGVIYDRYRPRLLVYTRQMLSGSRADAEDALQDVFLGAYGALRADARPVTLRAWLYRVAHNRCIDHVRRPANQPTCELPEQASGEDDLLARLQLREDLRRLIADLHRLPAQQRSALLMREMEGLSYAELADALGVSLPAVKSLLVRARIGLTEARDARATACVEIRGDLLTAHYDGVRANGRARRHLRECANCAAYRTRLRGVADGLSAVAASPTGWGAWAKLLGLGGTGGGSIAGGVLATGGTAKVAALVCCAAVVGGGAVGASRELRGPERSAQAPAASVAPARPVDGARSASPVGARGPRAVNVRASPRPAGAKPVARSAAGEPPVPSVIASAAQPAAPGPVADDEPPTLGGPSADAEPPSLGGPSADADVLQAATAGGTLAPEEPVAPEPLLPADADAPVAPLEPVDAVASDPPSEVATPGAG